MRHSVVGEDVQSIDIRDRKRHWACGRLFVVVGMLLVISVIGLFFASPRRRAFREMRADPNCEISTRDNWGSQSAKQLLGARLFGTWCEWLLPVSGIRTYDYDQNQVSSVSITPSRLHNLQYFPDVEFLQIHLNAGNNWRSEWHNVTYLTNLEVAVVYAGEAEFADLELEKFSRCKRLRWLEVNCSNGGDITGSAFKHQWECCGSLIELSLPCREFQTNYVDRLRQFENLENIVLSGCDQCDCEKFRDEVPFPKIKAFRCAP